MRAISTRDVKIFALALACTIIATFPNYTWVPARIEAIHPDQVNSYWVSFACRLICMLAFFSFQAHYNIVKLNNASTTHRLAINAVMMFAFIVVYLCVSAFTPLHITTSRGMQVVVYQVLIVGLVNIMIGMISQSRPQPATETVEKQIETPADNLTETTASYQDKILLPTHDHVLPIDMANIAGFYTSEKRTLILLTDGKKLEYNKTLQQIMQTLNPKQFFRVNKQFIVSRTAVKEFSVWFDSRLLVTLCTDVPEPIYVPKNKAGEFKLWLSHM